MNTANTATLSNLPDGVTSGFRLEVIANTGIGWNKQILYPNGNIQRIWIRQQGDGWTGWYSTLTNANIQHGRTAVIDLPPGEITSKHYTFPKQFSSPPNVVATLFSNSTLIKYGLLTMTVHNITIAGFDLRFYNNADVKFSPAVNWIAVS